MSTRILKYLTPVLQPLYRKYFSRTRPFYFRSINILVYPGVFYPGFTFSTKIFLRYIDSLDLSGKTFLELGAGSGIISLLAAGKGAIVTSTDINPEAVRNIRDNAIRNNMKVNFLLSDLFDQIPMVRFDYIIIAPPYYPKDPSNYAEMAWYCGKNFEYFDKLFHQLPAYYYDSCTILMILSEDCDIRGIKERASVQGFDLIQILEKKKLGEKNFIFRIRKQNADN